MNRYSYEELRKAAVEIGTPETLEALAEWFSEFGMVYWNGESWNMDDGLSLFPVFGEEDDSGCFPVVGYEIR